MENMNNKQVILSLVSTYNNLPSKVHHACLFIWGTLRITNTKMQQFVKGPVKQSNILETPKTAKRPFVLNVWDGKITKVSNNKTLKCYHFVRFCTRARIKLCVLI